MSSDFYLVSTIFNFLLITQLHRLRSDVFTTILEACWFSTFLWLTGFMQSVLYPVDKCFGDLIWSLDRLKWFLSQSINLENIADFLVNNGVELKCIDFDGKTDYFIEIPLHDEIVVWVCEDIQGCGWVSWAEPAFEVGKRGILNRMSLVPENLFLRK